MSETAKEAKEKTKLPVDKKTLLKAWELMSTAKRMSEIYNENIQMTSKYVHATSRGHEAAQLALALQLKPQDFVAPYGSCPQGMSNLSCIADIPGPDPAGVAANFVDNCGGPVTGTCHCRG